ncbi:MAG: site-2 protease family protein [Actinomycetota bacterium]
MGRIDLYGFIGAALGIFVGMIGHEYAHARTAVAFGDPTPRMMGRLTLNPKAHVDPFGTIIMPAVFLVTVLFRASFGFFFGYAKPVTVHPGRMRNPKRDAILVALAGPGFNLALAAVAGFAFQNAGDSGRLLQILLWITVINSFLFIINILPIPPLDGSRILARFLSPAAAMKMEELGQYLILFLLALFLIFPAVLENMGEAVYCPLLGSPFGC